MNWVMLMMKLNICMTRELFRIRLNKVINWGLGFWRSQEFIWDEMRVSNWLMMLSKTVQRQ
jgi:hypothetical protein